MSLFDKIFRPAEAKQSEEAIQNARTLFQTLNAYQPTFTNWGGAVYESEIVRAAIDARARHISKLKIEINGTANPSLQAKLRLGPNQWQTWTQFLYRTSTILDVNNTAFIVPVFDANLTITGIYSVLPSSCSLVEYNNEIWLRYRFNTGQTAAVELRKCAILTKYQYKDDFFGSSNWALRETMQMIHTQNEGVQEGIKNSANIWFMAQLANFAKPDDLANERKRFTAENLSSESDLGGFLLFPNTYKDIKQIDVKPYAVDADQMDQIRSNVFNYFGVNENVLQNKAKAEELEGFFDGCIEPFAIQLSEALTKMLFSERERAQGSFVMANANRLQYMSTTQKVQMAQQLLDRGVMSINEARELFNYGEVENGDVRFIRGEYIDANEKVTEQETEDENDGQE